MMRCASYAAAEEYDLTKVADYLTTVGHVVNKLTHEILHAKVLPDEEGALPYNIFVFQYGCLIIWGANQAQEKITIKKLNKYTKKPFKIPYDDLCGYVVDDVDETTIDEENDRITLGKDHEIAMISISYALSQSIKLSQFEDSVMKTMDAVKDIPRELIEFGKFTLSRRELAQKMGELLAVRNLINLHSDLLDTPEFFWRRPKWEPYYIMTLEFLDIKTRIDILNKRLDVLHELYEMISNELQHSHASRLEWIIIYLILCEIIISVLRDLLGWI